MRMKRIISFTVGLVLILSGQAISLKAATTNQVFFDDFEVGMANWTPTGTSPLDWSAAQNLVPPGPGHSAYLNSSLDRMYHNLGAEVSGWSVLTYYLYDGPATRAFGEVRCHTGNVYNPSALQNLYAIGKYSSVTMGGEVWDSTKYQGRIANGPGPNGWFNLNAPGAPSRSAGWHRFDIVRQADGTTYEFYVDGVLSRSFAGVTDYPWDCPVIGSVGAGSTVGDAWFDGVFVGTITNPPPVKEYFFKTKLLPPPEGVYVTPAMWHAAFANGIIIRDVRHRAFTQGIVPPPTGVQVGHSFGSQVEMEVSTDGGGTWTPAAMPVGTSVSITHTEDADGRELYATEMLMLEGSAGGVMIRESPTRAGTGGTTIREVPGGNMISSFFDIYIEVSIDGGGSWEPALEPAHVELRPDPALAAPVPTLGRLLPPPNDQYVSPADYHIALASGIVIRDVKHKLFTQSTVPPPAGAPAVQHHFDSQLDFQLSTDNGRTWQLVRTPAGVDVSIARLSSGEEELYETEMLGLSVSGMPGLLIRESPTEPSRGMTAIRGGGGGGGGGGAVVQSFFDIFIEVSTDGGQSWQPGLSPARVEAQSIAPVNSFPSDVLPPPEGEYVSPAQWHALFASGIVIKDVVHERFMQSFPPPAPGMIDTHSFDSTVRMQVSTDGGATFVPMEAPASATVNIASSQEEGQTRYFDTEMLSLNVAGGSLPAGVMIRESPTRASLGRTSLRSALTGVDHDCDSFFDIYIEVSTDGGQSWLPASAPATVVLQPGVPRPLIIACPKDITTNAVSPAGTVVTWMIITMGGTPPINVNCVPASGSTFPIGVTPVTCTATDASGQTAQCSFKVTVRRPRPPAHFFRAKLLPPPAGEYISPQSFHAYFANGIVISNVAHRVFTQGVLPPEPGGPPVVHTFGSQAEMEVSTDGGVTFQPFVGNASMTVEAVHADMDGDAQIIDNQVQAFAIDGPPGVLIRESPTLASAGQTTIRPVSGGYMIDSFFDIFTEVSTDGGATWSPAVDPATMELKVDPALIPPATAPRPVLPMPNGQYVSPQQWHQLYASGIILRDLKHKLFTQWMEPPPFGASQTHTFDSQLDFQVSTDGGATWEVGRAPGMMTVEIKNVREFVEKKEYNTLVIGLDIAGGDLPPGVIIRESPTKASEGGTATVFGPGDWNISSFFDIYTEVSTDGGGTWSPADNGPARVELERVAPVHEFPSSALPPPEGEYVSPAQWHAYFANGIVIRNVVHHRFTQPVAPPEPGKTLTHTFGSQVEMDVSTDGGTSWNPVSMPATVTVQITGRLGGDGLTEYFDTEMVQLDIQGGGTALPIAIRESPTRASLGRTTITSSLIAAYQIDSFFDIFTEVSTDGGQSWLPASAPATVTLQPAGIAPLTITCPPNQVVQATKVGGAVVTYPAPTISGGTPPIAATCTPPSGSHFRVGVTPVTCVARDAAGQTARCTFTVKVLPPRRFERAKLLPPADGMYISPQQWHALYANGIIVSNVIHKRFTQGIEPPPPGETVTHSFGSEVQLEVAMGPDADFQPFTAQADVTVRLSHLAGPSIEEIYEAEMLQLNVRGGTLPPMVLMRLSPLTPSKGETRIVSVTGGFMIDSFFDIFTEVSTDGGMTWSPSPDSAAVELTIDPTTVPSVEVPTALLPPLVHKYVSPQDWHVAFANGVVITDVRHAVFTGAILPPPYGMGASHTFDSQIDMLVTTGLGAPTRMRAPATMTVGALHVQDFESTLYLETEAVQLNIAGGDLPAGLRLRESPTLPSRGGTAAIYGPGGWNAHSFFDIWVELSTDGGASWSPATSGPVRVELQTIAPEVAFLTPVLPPQEGEYVSVQQWHAYYAQGIIISNVIHRRFTEGIVPPPPGASATHTFGSEVAMDVSTDNGMSWQRLAAPATVTVRITSLQDQDATRYFDTEMLRLDIAGGDLPPGVMIRESPTRASTGRTSERSLPTESFMISSFFDVFTELSTDGGLTWQPSLTGPATVILRPSVCEPPVITTEPVDAAVYCHSNATFCVEAKGTPPLRYQWYENGVAMPGENGRCLTILNPIRAQNGNQYYVVVANDCGSDTSQTATLTVVDIIPPVIDCPPDQSAETTPGRCDAVVQYPAPRATDDCGWVTGITCNPPSGATFPLGTTTVTCVATDDSGNTGRCEFKVVVVDNELPRIACPPSLVLETDPGTCRKANVTYTATATDNCPGVTVACAPPSGSTFPLGVTLVTCTATDSSGNTAPCDFNVTVRDLEAPRITCPADIVANTDPGVCVKGNVTYTATATDNCPGVTVACVPPSGSTFPRGSSVVTCTATDTSGNRSQCEFRVTIRDLEPPQITCPANIAGVTDPGICAKRNVTYIATATDNCPDLLTPVTCNPPSGSTFALGTTTVTCTATDSSGNEASCQFTVTIRDLEPPRITCPPSLVLETDPGTCRKTDVTYTATATDNCPGATVACVPPSGSTFALGVTAVTCTATDGSGNVASCNFTVTVRDVEPPQITCPPDMTVTAYAPTGAVVTYPSPTASDNCAVDKVTCTPPSGSVFPIGTTTVVCAATDTSGNESRCTFLVRLVPVGIEIDRFAHSVARLTVEFDAGGREEVTLAGPTEVRVVIGDAGECRDLDGDGLDQAMAEMTQLDLAGFAMPLGHIQLRLRPGTQTLGEVEERANHTPGKLDLPPFVAPPVMLEADSFFDVFVEVSVDWPLPRTYHSARPVHMVAVLTHKPPAPNEAYTSTAPVELLDELGQPTGIRLARVIHIPDPKEVDVFPNSEAFVTVRSPSGVEPVTLFLRGPTTVEVAIPPTGWAADTDGNGRDQAPARMTEMALVGQDPLGRPVTLRLAAESPTLGAIEERNNAALGLLDVAPFVPSPTVLLADSFFDVWFELGLLFQPPLHPAEPVHMETVLTHKPPAPGETYTNSPLQRPIRLLWPDGTPSEYEVVRVLHTPVPVPCGTLHVELVPPTIEPGLYDVMVCWKDDERCRLQWTRDLNTPIVWRDWTGPIITRPDGTKCVRITNPRGMMYFRLCGGCVGPAL